jgi:UDPglucose--hexose-1-phosphate uridylyltransferase
VDQPILRQNIITKNWVIYSPFRKKRPHDFKQALETKEDLPEYEQECPFCPGNEHLLERVIMETKDNSGDQWRTRVVPNKYPALGGVEDTDRVRQGLYMTMKGYGRHEVIIESPLHNLHTALMTEKELELVIESYHRRYLEIMENEQNSMVILFRNHGEQAGTSLIHPHSQLIVTGIVPQYIRRREEEAQRYLDEWGRCVFCDILEFEKADRKRFILENRSFLAFVPYAAEVPFETWIMPKRHQADFGSITPDEKSDLASALKQVMRSLYDQLNDPDYNYVINTCARYKTEEPQLHWYLQIRPRLTKTAGFEIGSGMNINPSLPEDDASFLRAST